MSSPSASNIPALDMAHCPNCGFAIAALGARTNCSKCGKKITILCITCQTNNPPALQFCMSCSADYRLAGVEFFHKQIAKLEFDLAEHARWQTKARQAALLTQLFQLGAFTLPFAIALICALIFSITRAAFIGIVAIITLPLLVKFFGLHWAQRWARLPAELAQDWQHLCRTAEKQAEQLQVMEKELVFFQNELNRFRKKLDARAN